MKKKVVFYVDGFNFYFGLKEMTKLKPDWRKFYWINFVAFFSQFLKEDEELEVVHYFTARHRNKGKVTRQNMLMNCNKALNGNKIKFHYGKYQDKTMTCRAKGGCGLPYMHWEEKQTDVSLAIKIIEDCHNNTCDKIVLVSGDSDFLPPIKLIKNIYKEKQIMILFPPCKYTKSMANLDITFLQMESYKPRWNRSLMEDVITVSDKTYRKPVEWST